MKENLKICDMPLDERPREKLLNNGVGALTDAELLALLLRTGNREDSALDLSKKLLNSVNGLEGIFNASMISLMNVKGIKEAKASQIIAACELYNRVKQATLKDFKIKSAKDVASLFEDSFLKDSQECVRLISLNTKNNVISTKEVFKGSLNSSIVHPREIFKEAISLSAASIILCHNHPSGDPTPSIEDINITKRIKSCGDILGIELLDHVILGRKKFISLKEKGII
ncbi:DNA repair protein RadC [uncultured Clostridium sp.]|uniref:RadC family protein n=1 Tax=uncultured Clostridium sp. TaxID=59620 RepID=UPI002621E8AF|nr:DNA repair protein RadC [uncultured Clostridium sp.]